MSVMMKIKRLWKSLDEAPRGGRSEEMFTSPPLLLEPMRERLACLYQLERLDGPVLREAALLLERLYALDVLDAVRPKVSEEENTVRVEEAGLLVMRGVRELMVSLREDIERLERELALGNEG